LNVNDPAPDQRGALRIRIPCEQSKC